MTWLKNTLAAGAATLLIGLACGDVDANTGDDNLSSSIMVGLSDTTEVGSNDLDEILIAKNDAGSGTAKKNNAQPKPKKENDEPEKPNIYSVNGIDLFKLLDHRKQMSDDLFVFSAINALGTCGELNTDKSDQACYYEVAVGNSMYRVGTLSSDLEADEAIEIIAKAPSPKQRVDFKPDAESGPGYGLKIVEVYKKKDSKQEISRTVSVGLSATQEPKLLDAKAKAGKKVVNFLKKGLDDLAIKLWKRQVGEIADALDGYIRSIKKDVAAYSGIPGEYTGASWKKRKLKIFSNDDLTAKLDYDPDKVVSQISKGGLSALSMLELWTIRDGKGNFANGVGSSTWQYQLKDSELDAKLGSKLKFAEFKASYGVAKSGNGGVMRVALTGVTPSSSTSSRSVELPSFGGKRRATLPDNPAKSVDYTMEIYNKGGKVYIRNAKMTLNNVDGSSREITLRAGERTKVFKGIMSLVGEEVYARYDRAMTEYKHLLGVD